ncbi:myosin-like protein [Arabidopsis thaliana]|nr:myosin-like protein [Arabidopsis thaliana]CAB81521.1 myosin-like protein [Arabidopsis thaliana]
MEGRGWPWKRKSSDKATTEKPVVGIESTPVCSLSYLASLENQEKCKNTNYVQITMDSYTHMSRMEDQVKLFEVQVKDLKEKLTLAHSEINTKESLILQHAKVAEEAVSGWEKADAETLALKRQLESVTLLKLTAEDRASHLDDALKECTRQIRIVKEESDKKLQDVILAKTSQWDKIKAELEGKIDELSEGLHRAASDNAALTRSLQERSEMIVRISEERSKAEADVEKLKTNLQLAEKEISYLKYDLHVASKEVEIRNEEKNMSLKSADIANKQHLEGVKKIAKLEAECHRLRGLLRKKLPGPAAMAQMKLEVEGLGHEFTDPRAQRNMSQNHNAHIAKAEISTDHKLEECKRENVYLTRRTLEMEEEIQTLKEHLSARNNELQVSRNVCAKTLGKLKILEGQMHMFNNDKNAPKSNSRNLSESLSSGHDHHYPPSVTSVSEDGFDEEGSSSECGPATSLDSHKVRKVSVNGSSKPRSSSRLELMDDFLEIEKLVGSDPDGANSASKSSNSVCSRRSVEKQSSSKSSEPDEDTTTLDQLLMVLRSRINRIFESQEGISIDKIVEAARFSIQEMQGSSTKRMSSHLFEVTDETLEKHVDIQNSEKEQKNTKQQDLEAAVANIHHFIKSTTKEATQLQDMNGNGQLRESLEDFSSSVSKYPTGESSLSDVMLELSRISVLASNLNNGALTLKPHSKEIPVTESNDKVTLLFEESDSNPLGDTFAKTDHCVDNLINGDDSSCKSLLKEVEQLKLEKENIAVELSRCLQNLESTKAWLEEKEQLISKLKSQLTSSEDLQSLAETQLKCVTESYKSLDLHAKELEAKVKSLEEETKRLEMAFTTEKHGHEETLAKCRDLQEKMQRYKNHNLLRSSTMHTCQETIHLLSQQLQSLQPQSNHILKSRSPEKKFQQHKASEVTPNSALDDLPHVHIIQPSRSVKHTVNPTVHAIMKSSSVSSSSKEDNEKHTRGLGRFFSSKSKNSAR